MRLEDWKEYVKKKDDIGDLLYWLIFSHDQYEKESRRKWECLSNASLLTENFRETVDWCYEEALGQKERFEWLYEYIATNYVKKGGIDHAAEKE